MVRMHIEAWVEHLAHAVPTQIYLRTAFNPLQRARGLLGQARLTPAHGVWLRPCNAVHCCFMRFAIDVLYLDAQLEIIAIRQRLRPWRWSMCRRACSVIELAAGECQRLRIQPGDRINCAP